MMERAVGYLNVHAMFPKQDRNLFFYAKSFKCLDGRPLRHSAGRLLMKGVLVGGGYNLIRRRRDGLAGWAGLG